MPLSSFLLAGILRLICFSEEQGTATKWLTELVNKSKPLTKETLSLRVPEHAQRGAEYERLLQAKIAGGMPIKQAAEAIIRLAAWALRQISLAPALINHFLQSVSLQKIRSASAIRTARKTNPQLLGQHGDIRHQ